MLQTMGRWAPLGIPIIVLGAPLIAGEWRFRHARVPHPFTSDPDASAAYLAGRAHEHRRLRLLFGGGLIAATALMAWLIGLRS